jgi:hypothetical protein
MSNTNNEIDQVGDNEYVTGRDDSIPVVKDEMPVEQSKGNLNPDSDESLGMLLCLGRPFLAFDFTRPHRRRSND